MTEIEYGTLEFALWLLLAVAVGFAVGWMLRKWWLDRKEASKIEELQREATAKQEALQTDLEKCQSQAGSLSRDLDMRTADLDRTKEQLAERDEKIASLEAEAAAAGNDVAQLEAKVQDLEATAASLRAKAEAEDPRVESLRGELDAANETIAALRGDADGYENTIESLRADLETARRTQAGLDDGGSAADRGSGPDAVPTDADLPDKEVAVAKVAEIATRTRGTGPAVEDDLTMIHGVGPKLEGLLKSMDITSFKQVANFTADDIQYVTAALDAFPGRIERDDWMGSAASEHSRKYGEPA